MSVGCRGVGRGRWRTDRLRNFPPKNAGCRNASCIFFDVREGRFVFLSGGFLSKRCSSRQMSGLTTLLSDFVVCLVLGLRGFAQSAAASVQVECDADG